MLLDEKKSERTYESDESHCPLFDEIEESLDIANRTKLFPHLVARNPELFLTSSHQLEKGGEGRMGEGVL